MRTYYVDGKFVPEDQAVIPVNDLAVLRGYGVCDIMRTYNSKPFFLNEHIQRLENSAVQIGLTLPWQTNEIKEMVIQTLEKNKPIDEANIRIIITGGSSTDFFSPDGPPRLIILITDIPKLPEAWYKKGVKVITHMRERDLPDAKTISYVPAAMALKQAQKKGAIEALYVNRQNHAMEGTTSNLFAFFGKTLVTPKEGVLKGITRQAVLALAKEFYPVKQKPIPLGELIKADEVFITGTNKGVVPVIQIDDTIIGNGVPGKSTKKLIKELEIQTQCFIET